MASKKNDDVVRDPRGYGRETVESIVVAFTLALLFRAFEAEAFVIPTGSMAPTLMGRHKDLVCASCGLDYRVGASAEEDDDSQRTRAELGRLEAEGRDLARIAQLRRKLGGKLVPRGRCPNCGHVMPLTVGGDTTLAYDRRYPSFNGDRILVDKFAYDFAEPERWDVVVFKYPEDAKTNYIKRLVGLPGETVFIAGGDIWTSRVDDPRNDDAEKAVIARKPPAKLRAMLQLVHDAAHASPELLRAGWPTAWTDWTAPDHRGARWRSDDDGRSFLVACGPSETATIRWRSLLPTPDIWQAIEAGRPVADRAEPGLVGDLQPYNVNSRGPHWVGDLAVGFELENKAAAGSLTIDLVKAGIPHRCTIDLADGRVTLARPAESSASEGALEAEGRTSIAGPGRWRILFANVDDALTLFVDDRPVSFTGPTAWGRSLEDALDVAPVLRGGTPGDAEAGDLSPVGITAAGADVRVADMQVLRDVYYIATGSADAMAGRTPEEEFLAFALEPGHYFMLGDNSSASKDSRAWGTPDQPLHSVERRLLIGRALVVFWPHGIPAKWSIPVKFMGQEVRLPFWPNFGRMGPVR